jgi:large subunit ribosomal protein L1
MARPEVTAREGIRVIAEDEPVRQFDESVELSLGLGLDPRKPNQSLRVMTQLPHGAGKQARIAVFARGDEAERALSAGAAIVGAEDLAEDIQSGNIDFTRCIATPDMMPVVGRVARILGPRGLMPNPKLGTVTLDVEAAVAKALKGEVELRTDKFGFVNCSIGKRSFTQNMLLDNLKAVMVTVSNEKPTGASGKYLKQAVLSSTMGHGVRVDTKCLDPSSTTFLD